MLSPTSPREALLACSPSPPWNLPFFTLKPPLSSPCSRPDPPLSHQGAALAHLGSFPPNDLVLWRNGSVPFPFGKGALAYLPSALFVVPRPLFYFQQTQYAQVFLLKPAPFCKLSVDLGSTNNSTTSLLVFFDSRSALTTLSSAPSFLLPQSL